MQELRSQQKQGRQGLRKQGRLATSQFTFWSERESRLCAFCRASRGVYLKRHISVWDIGLAVVLGMALWVPWSAGGPEEAMTFLDPRGILVGLVFIFSAEVFVVIRHRLSLNCPKCGFDPVTYRRNPEDAARRVREHLAHRAEDPRLLLAEPVRLPKRRKQVTSDEMISRHKARNLNPMTGDKESTNSSPIRTPSAGSNSGAKPEGSEASREPMLNL